MWVLLWVSICSYLSGEDLIGEYLFNHKAWIKAAQTWNLLCCKHWKRQIWNLKTSGVLQWVLAASSGSDLAFPTSRAFFFQDKQEIPITSSEVQTLTRVEYIQFEVFYDS